MKKFVVASFVAVGLLAACGGSAPASSNASPPAKVASTPVATPVPTPTPKPVPTTDQVLALLKQAGLPVGAVTVYTAETDTNHLLGRQGGYIGRMAWADTRLPAPRNANLSVDNGGGVEIFATEADMQARKAYLASFLGSLLGDGYEFAVGQYVLLRLPAALTPAQAEAYHAALGGLA